MRMLASRFTKSTQTWQHKVSVQVARLRCNFMTLNRFCVLRLHNWFAISVTRSSRKAAKAEEHHAANWTFRIRSPGRWIDVQTDSPGRCSKSEDRMNACFGESVCYDHKLEMQSPGWIAATLSNFFLQENLNEIHVRRLQWHESSAWNMIQIRIVAASSAMWCCHIASNSKTLFVYLIQRRTKNKPSRRGTQTCASQLRTRNLAITNMSRSASHKSTPVECNGRNNYSHMTFDRCN